MEEGFKLMFLGMGFVFLFLILLVLLMKVSGLLLNLGSEWDPGDIDQNSKRNRHGDEKVSMGKVAAAIAVAFNNRGDE